MHRLQSSLERSQHVNVYTVAHRVLREGGATRSLISKLKLRFWHWPHYVTFSGASRGGAEAPFEKQKRLCPPSSVPRKKLRDTRNIKTQVLRTRGGPLRNRGDVGTNASASEIVSYRLEDAASPRQTAPKQPDPEAERPRRRRERHRGRSRSFCGASVGALGIVRACARASSRDSRGTDGGRPCQAALLYSARL